MFFRPAAVSLHSSSKLFRYRSRVKNACSDSFLKLDKKLARTAGFPKSDIPKHDGSSRIFGSGIGARTISRLVSTERQESSAYCTCPAGEEGMHCKHRIRILQGSTEGIVSPNERDVAVVAGWLVGTDVEVALRRVISLENEAVRVTQAL